MPDPIRMLGAALASWFPEELPGFWAGRFCWGFKVVLSELAVLVLCCLCGLLGWEGRALGSAHFKPHVPSLAGLLCFPAFTTPAPASFVLLYPPKKSYPHSFIAIIRFAQFLLCQVKKPIPRTAYLSQYFG